MGRILLFPFWSHYTALHQNLVHLKLLNKLMVHFYEQYPMLCISVCGCACTHPDFHEYFLHKILGAHLEAFEKDRNHGIREQGLLMTSLVCFDAGVAKEDGYHTLNVEKVTF